MYNSYSIIERDSELLAVLGGRFVDALIHGMVITNVQRLSICTHAYLHGIPITEGKKGVVESCTFDSAQNTRTHAWTT